MTAREEIEASDEIHLTHLVCSVGDLEIRTKPIDKPDSLLWNGRFLISRDLEITYKGEPLPMSMVESLTLTIEPNAPVRCHIKFAIEAS